MSGPSMSGKLSVVHVAVEVGHQKSFASALDWPGWSRSGKDEDAAIEALHDYAERYRDLSYIGTLDPKVYEEY